MRQGFQPAENGHDGNEIKIESKGEKPMNMTAVIVINLALVFYSIGVWSERLQGRLKTWHTVFFWFGLVCDTLGTGMMFDFVGGMQYNLHGISGVLAIILMFIHAIWATAVLIRKNEKMIANFHKFSLLVWIIWLIPYFSPMILRMVEAAK
jgi:uncharacterized repeat protein (TIGR03987 family)